MCVDVNEEQQLHFENRIFSRLVFCLTFLLFPMPDQSHKYLAFYEQRKMLLVFDSELLFPVTLSCLILIGYISEWFDPFEGNREEEEKPA